jgi:hypothetical protein
MVLETQKISASDHSIKSVTVFKSSKAEVTRTCSLDLKVSMFKSRPNCAFADRETYRLDGIKSKLLTCLVILTLNPSVSLGPPIRYSLYH